MTSTRTHGASHDGARVARRGILSLLTAAALLAAAAPSAQAWPRENERDGWVFGLSYGMGVAQLDFNIQNERVSSGWEWGATPQLRLGRMVGDRLMVSLEQQAWFDEEGVFVPTLPDQQLRTRASVQALNLAVTWFPGRPESPWGGAYLQAGAGISNSRIIFLERLEPDPDRPPSAENYEELFKSDETGPSVFAGVGYELRISRPFAIGATASFNHLFVEDTLYQEVTFYPVTLHMNWYF